MPIHHSYAAHLLSPILIHILQPQPLPQGANKHQDMWGELGVNLPTERVLPTERLLSKDAAAGAMLPADGEAGRRAGGAGSADDSLAELQHQLQDAKYD